MDYKMIENVVCNTLSMLGISAQPREEKKTANQFKASGPVLAMISMIGNIRVHMIYSMEMQTAENIVAAMMGASEYTMDSIGRSAVAELANMISGGICTALSADDPALDITTPTVLTGKWVNCTIHSVRAAHITFGTQLGTIGIDFAFES